MQPTVYYLFKHLEQSWEKLRILIFQLNNLHYTRPHSFYKISFTYYKQNKSLSFNTLEWLRPQPVWGYANQIDK